jgi:hypothetical protein
MTYLDEEAVKGMYCTSFTDGPLADTGGFTPTLDALRLPAGEYRFMEFGSDGDAVFGWHESQTGLRSQIVALLERAREGIDADAETLEVALDAELPDSKFTRALASHPTPDGEGETVAKEVKRVNDQLREVQAEGIELPRGARIPPGKIDEALAKDGLSVLDGETDGPASPVLASEPCERCHGSRQILINEPDGESPERSYRQECPDCAIEIEAKNGGFEARRGGIIGWAEDEAGARRMVERIERVRGASPVLGDEERERLKEIAQQIEYTIKDADWPEFADGDPADPMDHVRFLRKLAQGEERDA